MKKIIASILMCTFIICTSCNPNNQSEQTASKSPQEAVIENILTRRSIRQYKSTPLDSLQLRQIIECGLFAPNGKGMESWEVRVVTNPDILQRINLAYNNNDTTQLHAFFNAPALIFVAYDTRYDLSQVDCGLLGGNIMVSARSMGIGTCCLGGICRFFNAPEGSALLKRLDFPETHKLLYAIALGYPDESPAPKPRMMEKVKFIE